MNSTGTLVAIDPGENAGWSEWEYRLPGWYALKACGCNKVPHIIRPPDVLIVERPEIYQGGSKKAADDNIIALAINLGRRIGDLECLVLAGKNTPVYGVYPKTWKKSISKTAHETVTRNALMQLGGSSFVIALSAESAYVPSVRNNMWDAVALGLWACKRIDMLGTVTDCLFQPLK